VNRERDWANVLTSHKNSEKPCLWSTDSHSIIKKKIELFDSFSAQKDNLVETMLQQNNVTSVFVTNCGNFGILGFKNGLITKINMQSGHH